MIDLCAQLNWRLSRGWLILLVCELVGACR